MSAEEKKIEEQLNELLTGQYTSNEVSKALIGKVVDIGKDLGELREKWRSTPASLSQEIERQLEDIDKRLGMLGDSQAKAVEREQRVEKAIENEVSRLLKGHEGLTNVIDHLKKILEMFQGDLEAHRLLFEKPLHKEVHYRLFLGRPLWFLMVGIVAVCVGSYMWQKSMLRADSWEGNDWRWRYVDMSYDSVVRRELEKADKLYKADPVAFRKQVEQEEARRKELAEKWIQMQETQQAIDDLNKAGKKR